MPHRDALIQSNDSESLLFSVDSTLTDSTISVKSDDD